MIEKNCTNRFQVRAKNSNTCHLTMQLQTLLRGDNIRDDDDDDDECFSGMADGRKTLRLISSRGHCQRFSPLNLSRA